MSSNDTGQGAVRRHDPNGYLRHLITGAGLSVAAAAWGARPDVVLGVAAVAGIAKEAYDAATGRGHVDWLDAVFTALGGAVVAAAVLALR